MSTHELTLHVVGDLDFTYALDTYVIYPWVRDGDELVRPLRIGAKDAHLAVARIRQDEPTRLHARVTVDDAVPDGLAQAEGALRRCLQLDLPYDQIAALTHDDPVLAAAVAHRGLGRGKLYPDLFEALCGGICAGNTVFKRIYAMMRNLSVAFGQPTGEVVDGEPVFAFPTPAQMAAATDEQLRECKVGYRSKNLAAAATFLANSGYSWADWADRTPGEVVPELMGANGGIKGVGKYTANLAVNLSYGQGGAAHVDTYVRDIIGRLYLDDPAATAEEVAAFIDQRWGTLGETVLDFLTTETEVWVVTLGKTVGVRSGAKS